MKLSYLAPADALAAFSTGQVDAWVTWHPFIAQAKAEGAKTIAGGPPDEFGHSFEIASSKAVADPKRAAALKDYIARLRKAFAWGAENPDKWAAAWSKESGLPLATTKVAVRARLADIQPVTEAGGRAPAGARRPAGRGQGAARGGRRSPTSSPKALIEGGTLMSLKLHWFLPTTGDARGHPRRGHRRSARTTPRAGGGAGERPPTVDYLGQIARSAEQLGFEAALTPTGSWCEDAWVDDRGADPGH